MKTRISRLLGLLCYLLVIGMLLNFNWISFIKPKPFIAVILGMLILTGSQYKKGYGVEDLITAAKWNLLFAGFLTSLMSILSYASIANIERLNLALFSEQLLPLLYSSILYLFINLVFENPGSEPMGGANEITSINTAEIRDLTNTMISDQVFQDFELTNRERHVAAKLLENISNKEIAAQLYISEATVKKHIQNIYQKLNAIDRNSFREIYMTKAKDKIQLK